MGVASERSLAWSIAKACCEEGAEIALTYQDDIFLKRIEPLAAEIQAKAIKCDVTKDELVAQTFEEIRQTWGKLDFIVHAIAFSKKEELQGSYVANTTLDNFLNTMHISCYSFTAVSRYASELMADGGSLLTLTYLGSEKVIPNYNVMGVAKAALECSVRYIAADLGSKNIRVNAISAGPVRTLAASGISDFRSMLDHTESHAPMRRNISGRDVADAATFLLSDRARNITGEILHVDSGMHVVGMGSA